jgi:RNA polymerase sigma-70 factor, ECF subfamily
MTTPDAALVEHARQGDQQAFAILYRRYQRVIYSLIRHLTSDEEAAADLTQETFIKAWHALPRLRTNCAFSGWLRIIATNLVRDRGRRRRPETTITDHTTEDGLELDPADEGLGPEERLTLHERRCRIREAVARLPEQQRLVVVMHHFEEMPVADIAASLGIPLGTVLSRLARGRDALKRRLGPHVEQGM